MPGINTNGLPLYGSASLPVQAGLLQTALVPVDTEIGAGSPPQSVAMSPAQMMSAGPQFTVSAPGATPVLNWNNGAMQNIVIGANITSMAAPLNPVDGQTYTLVIQQDGTGNRTWVPPTSFKFPGGTSTLSTAANAIDFVQALYNATRGIYLCTLDKALA